MSERATFVAARSVLTDADSGPSEICIARPRRERCQAPTRTYTEAELWLYRDRTKGLLRRYLRMSVEVGRLPSLLGRELFRARVSSYRATSFEEAVIFARDVERCLEKLNELDRKILTRIIFQEYTFDEAAEVLGCWRRTVGRRFADALDRLSGFLLDAGLLRRFPDTTSDAKKTCQEGENVEISVSDSEQAE
jgi:RNA polymerase sigma factor (sigma-70 family)